MQGQTSSNPHEEAARKKKVAALVAEIDAQAVAQCLDPKSPHIARLIAESYVGKLSEEGWQDLAKFAGCCLPSEKTRRLVLYEYIARSLADLKCGSSAPETFERCSGDDAMAGALRGTDAALASGDQSKFHPEG